MRWGFLSDRPTLAFIHLANMALPANRGTLKKTSSLAVPNKVFIALETIGKKNGNEGEFAFAAFLADVISFLMCGAS